jgi:hypothetical protein
MSMHGLRDGRQSLDLVVIPQTGEEERRVERVLANQVAADDDQADAPSRAFLVVGDGLVGELPLVGASYPHGASGGEDDPVLQLGLAHPPGRVGYGKDVSIGILESLRCAGLADR